MKYSASTQESRFIENVDGCDAASNLSVIFLLLLIRIRLLTSNSFCLTGWILIIEKI